MKILHILHQYLPEKIGGTELYTRTLARRQVESGHDVSILSPTIKVKNWPEPAIEDSVQVYRLPLGTRSATAVFQHTFRQSDLNQAFQRLLEDVRSDIVHIQHLMGLPTSLVNHLTAAAIPFIITLHDYWYICANAQLITNYDDTICAGPNWWLNCARCALARAGRPNLTPLQPTIAPVMALRNHRLKKALNQAAKLIAPTDFVRQTYTQLGIKIEQIQVIPHGIQLPETKPVPKDKTADRLQITYIGGLSPQKGIHTLIDAVNGLPPDKFNLAIYGDMTAFPAYIIDLQNQIQQPNIQFKGVLPHEKLWDGLAKSDVVVVPSLWYETASLIVQEAFAAGVPVIASNIGALQERVRDGIDGYLFPAGDAAVLSDLLLDLGQHPEKLAQLAAQIQPVFTIDQHETAVHNQYQLALAESSAV